MEKDDIINLAQGLYQQAFDANCIFSMICQYKDAEKNYKDVLGYFPAFYSITYNSMLKACFMELAKLYDNTLTSIGGLLRVCAEDVSVFPKYHKTIEYEIDGEKYTSEVPYQHNLKKRKKYTIRNMLIHRGFYMGFLRMMMLVNFRCKKILHFQNFWNYTRKDFAA